MLVPALRRRDPQASTSHATLTSVITTYQVTDLSIVRVDLRTGTYIEEPRVFRVDTYLESPTTRVIFRP